jgi:spore coat protein A
MSSLRVVRHSVFVVSIVFSGAVFAGHSHPSPGPLPGGNIQKYTQPLSIPPVIDATQGSPFTITMSEFQTQVLPSSFPKTTVWGYNNAYPGPTVVAKRGVAAKVNYVNKIASPKLLAKLPVDQTLHWADPLKLGCAMMTPPLSAECFQRYTGPVPTTVHLHGAEVPSAFDGTPDSWFTASGLKGAEFVTSSYIYPNNQEATTLWYHDHALGVTRLNVFAGLTGMYLLTDPAHEPANLPSGKFALPLIIQDRSFDTKGQLFFPSDGINPDLHPFWQPEFFGDVILVNGKSWPFLNVEPRRYRFRLLDASNARFYTLKIVKSDGSPGPVFWQIGSDGGYLNRPVRFSELTIAPAERMDVVVDFTGLAVGTKLLMTNSANAPFPGGDPVDPATTAQVMQFKVVASSGSDGSVAMSNGLKLRPKNSIVDLRPTVAGSAPGTTVPLRRLVLKEIEGANGPEMVTLNNTRWMAPVTETPRVGATEVWELINITEDAHPIHVHLVQFQLINRQDLDPEAYTAAYEAAFPGGVFPPAGGTPLPYGNCYPAGVCGGNPDPTPFLAGTATPPDANEAGWKDTFHVFPGQVTRFVIRWAPQNVPAGTVGAGTNLFRFDPTATLGTTDTFGFPGGAGYVWHCHILDHEDNEMMRPYLVNN